MKNKFLEKYPVFWEPKVGDLVVMLNNHSNFPRDPCWVIGSLGRVVETYAIEPKYRVDFNEFKNVNKENLAFGYWWVKSGEFTLALQNQKSVL